MGRADANLNHRIRRDRGGTAIRNFAGTGTSLSYARRADLIRHFYRVLAWRTADHRTVYVFGHAAAVYVRRNQHR